MDRSSDQEVLLAAVDWLETSDAVFLVTVAQTWGSSPRRAGCLMVIHPDGQFVGSVSGGCVEDDLAQRVQRGEFDTGLPMFETYGVRSEQAQRVGLPCGGTLKLLLERIDNAEPLRQLLTRMDAGQQLSRRVCLDSGQISLHQSLPLDGLEFDTENLAKTFGPRWRLLLIGSGELSRRVAQLALTLDFAVTICDPRPEYHPQADSKWQVEGATFVTRSPRRAVLELPADRRTAILALSHTPALDDQALISALDSDAYYVGALGSKKSHQARCGRLTRHGISSEQLNRLHGPVGLDIGSRTPAEIAVAIAADLIQTRQRPDSTALQVVHA
ncbi:MAG: XdhC family protein [Gammaproteobacteria bacterium]|nr:XdhC family protein [Gammaproteobacteria bacterium]